MKRKLLSFFIALTLVFQIYIINTPIIAEGASYANLIASSETAEAGDMVYLTVSLTSNPGLTYVKLKLSYDTNALTLVSVQNGNVINDLTRGNSYVWSTAHSTTTTGTFATLIFSVSETASAKNYPITITCVEASNNDNDVEMIVNNGNITVIPEECLHNMQSVSFKEPTCERDGKQVLECTKCDYSETIILDAIDCVAENEADCTNDSDCKYCGEVLEEAYGHKYREQIIEPTTESEGYSLYTCMHCEESYKDNFLPPIQDHSHSYLLYRTVEVTCTSDGYSIYKCSDDSCGHTYKDDYVYATGHSYHKNVISATCEENGYTLFTCNNCGDSYKGEFSAANGHNYQNGVCKGCGRIDTGAGDNSENKVGKIVSINTETKYFTEATRAKLIITLNNNEAKNVSNLEYYIYHNSPNGELMGSGQIDYIGASSSVNFYIMLDRSYDNADAYYIVTNYTVDGVSYSSYQIGLVAPIVNGELAAFCTYEDWQTDDHNYHVANCEYCEKAVRLPHWYTEQSPDRCVICESQNDAIATTGDVNGDGMINDNDVELFAKYLTDWNVEVNTNALDVNGDGKVNNKDVTRLMQYLAGWDVEIK